jgi:hypothetical protein
MLRFYCFSLILVSIFGCRTAKKVPTPISEEFPKTWVGNWGGTLDIFSVKGKSQSVPMEVEIKKIDTSSTRYIFALIYGEDKVKGRRAYETIIKDPSKGLFVNDEKNTIQMEEYFINNRLHCWFEVEGTLLLSIFEKRGEELIFDIISGSATPVSVTGNQKFEGEDIPAVKTFPVKGVQHAILKRLPN